MAEQADLVMVDMAELLTRYSFDLGIYPLHHWIDYWMGQYPLEWLPKAVIEALYQGRYKAVSVWQILDLWHRRGRPLYHFNREFERIIAGRLLYPAAQSVITSPQSLLVSTVNGNSAYSVSRKSENQQTRHRAESRFTNGASWSSDQPLFSMPTSQPETNRLIVPEPRGISTSDADDQPPLSIQPFKPPPQFKLTLPPRYRQLGELSANPIQQFVPSLAESELHSKLKAMAASLLNPLSQPSPFSSPEATPPEPTAAASTEAVFLDAEPETEPEVKPVAEKNNPYPQASEASLTELESAMPPDAQLIEPDLEDQAEP